MAVISYKCPNCGGELVFDPETQKYKCGYCLSEFTDAEAEQANPKAAAGTDAREEEFSEAVVYTCPNCGAELLTDGTTAATFCFYCHSPVVLSGRVSGKYLPDRILPFVIDRKEAVDRFLKDVRKKLFILQSADREGFRYLFSVLAVRRLFRCGLQSEGKESPDLESRRDGVYGNQHF